MPVLHTLYSLFFSLGRVGGGGGGAYLVFFSLKGSANSRGGGGGANLSIYSSLFIIIYLVSVALQFIIVVRLTSK